MSNIGFSGSLNRMKPLKIIYDVILIRWRHLGVTSSHSLVNLGISLLSYALSPPSWCLNYALWGYLSNAIIKKPSVSSSWYDDVIWWWRHHLVGSLRGHFSAIIHTSVFIEGYNLWFLWLLVRFQQIHPFYDVILTCWRHIEVTSSPFWQLRFDKYLVKSVDSAVVGHTCYESMGFRFD